MRVPIRRGSGPILAPQDPKMTKEKFKELQAKLDFWLKIKRPKEAEEVKRLALMGDFSENVGYQLAKGRLRGLNQRIIELTNLLARAEIIDRKNNLNQVDIGSNVKIKIEDKIKIYTILGSAETDPANAIISHVSPLGIALLGKKINEEFVLKTGNKEKKCQILEIF